MDSRKTYLNHQLFALLVSCVLIASAWSFLYYGLFTQKATNHNEPSPGSTSLPQFRPSTAEGWGRQVVSGSNQHEVDQELLSIWENSKSVKITTSDANILMSTSSLCLIRSRGNAEINGTDWRISSKRNALEKVAQLIVSFQQDSIKSKVGFINGKIITLRFNEGDKSVEISFEAHLPCS